MNRSARRTLLRAFAAAGTALAVAGAAAPGFAKASAAAPGVAQASATAPGVAQASATAPAAALDAAKLPAVVARVDGTPISRERVLFRAGEFLGMLASQGNPLPTTDREFYTRIVEDLVANQLLMREIARLGVAITPQEVDQRFAEAEARAGGAVKFAEVLQRRGVAAADVRADLTEALTVQKWIRETLAPQIKVTDADVQQFYDQNPDRMVEPESIEVKHILIRVPQGGGEEAKAAARKRAADVLARLRGGADFATVAREVTEDQTSKPNGGDLGRVHRGQTVPEFETLAFGLPEGKLSDVVESRFGFHVVLTGKRYPQQKMPLEKVKQSIGTFLLDQKLQDRVKATVLEKRGQARVEILL